MGEQTDRKAAKTPSLLKFFVCLSVFVAITLAATAHEPITTKVRFNKEVVRVLQRNCLGCHHQGGIAMSLGTYEEARPWAKAIKEELLEKRMPPWNAVKGYGEFCNAPSLTQHEVDLMVNWVEGGAPKGDDQDLPSGPLISNDWALGKPDYTLKLGKVEVASDSDEVRTFVTPTKLKEDQWIMAADLRPGNRSVVHCATISIKGSDCLTQGVHRGSTKKGVIIDRVGVAMTAPVRDAASMISSWTPGQKPVLLPKEVGQLLSAGSCIVVKIHYRGSGGETVKDESAVGLYFSKTSSTRPLREVALSNSAAVAPAGESSHRVETAVTIQEDVEAIAIRPLVHPLIVSLQTTVYRPDGVQDVLIWARGQKTDWRTTYYFKQPVLLPKGTRVELIAYLDNSETNQNISSNDPPKTVRWSELTSDPMCSLLVVNKAN